MSIASQRSLADRAFGCRALARARWRRATAQARDRGARAGAAGLSVDVSDGMPSSRRFRCARVLWPPRSSVAPPSTVLHPVVQPARVGGAADYPRRSWAGAAAVWRAYGAPSGQVSCRSGQVSDSRHQVLLQTGSAEVSMANRRLAASPNSSRRNSPSRRRISPGRNKQIAKYPEGRQGVGGDPAAVARAGAGRRLAAAEAAIRARRRHARHGAYPRARGRDLLHHVPARAGRQEGARAGLRHDAVHAARRRRAVQGLPPIASTRSRSMSRRTATSPGWRSSASAPA